jgi:hypothetical protein
MQHYVGLDVSLKQTAVCVVDQAGKIRREGMVVSDPKAIADFIAANAPQVSRIGLESGATFSSDERWLPIYQLGGPRRERVQLAPPNNKPEVLEQSSDLVLEIPFQLDEQGTAAEKGSDGMAIEIFDANLLVPTALHDARDADGIVAIALVDLHL